MKNILLLLLIFLPFILKGQIKTDTTTAPLDTITAPIIYVGDSSYIATMPLSEVDITCKECIDEYGNNMILKVEKTTIWVFKDQIVMYNENSLIKTTYIMYNIRNNNVLAYETISRDKYEFSLQYNDTGKFYILFILNPEGIISTYKLRLQ